MTGWRVGDRVTHPDRGPGRVDSLAPNPLIVWVAFDREQEWEEVPTIVPVDRDILKAETPTPSPAELERLWALVGATVYTFGPLRVTRTGRSLRFGWRS